MNALNIMWLLNEIDRNTSIEIKFVKTKSTDWIEIETGDFSFCVDEYGKCGLIYKTQPRSIEKDIEYWTMVKDWVKKYYQENF